MILNRKLRGLEAGREVRNFDAFDIALNHIHAAVGAVAE